MKSLLSNKILILLVRTLLGAVFVIASLNKITDPQAFAHSILQYKIVGPAIAMGTATILPSLELLCGLSLLIGLYPRASALLMSIMLFGFTISVLSALFRGLDISCGCFSQDPLASKIGYQKVGENCGLMMLSVWMLFTKNYGINILQLLSKNHEPSDKNTLTGS